MFSDIIRVVWFILPAYVANSIAIDVSGVPFLKKYDTPMDFGRSVGGKRILGDGKTWRGFISGVLAAVLTGYLQQSYQADGFVQMTPLLGFLLGFGALGGDAAASFIKRRTGLGRGHPVFLLDQLDYVFGAFLAASLVVPLDFPPLFLACLITLPIHYISNIVAWLLKLKPKPW
ncbi:MAG: CDP-2,3-bis-(O-geranylgeranyl)-sn-glycerol synthase [Candidatus Altiarchaeales archaeon]|nr:CDP-2,3-bis-(O-geranylgeranyl)-sn-glycerol synthase [Candidatus Altiarchaeales archaeon]MBD3417245.1 CDP-2,3-bis-(O-geranylgeranyl)-sn-glycerol synthase [Candidatus Altiarchaeales archaeon]